MITLSSEYQYIGRSSAVKAYGSAYYYYILLYAKTVATEDTGVHTVSVKMRLACDRDATFYGYQTTGSATINGEAAISWARQKIPAEDWSKSGALTEDGHYYYRYVDLKEGTVEVATEYDAETEINIAAVWQRLAISTTPPNWLPSTTTASANIAVLLPAITNPNPGEDPGDEDDEKEVVLVPASGLSVYADGNLVFNSRLEDTRILGLKTTTGVNKSGTAEIILPPGHPAYNLFTSFRTVVTIYDEGALQFRGRALYPADNFFNQRTIMCEGERGFLQDAIARPYLYQDTPAGIFATALKLYNASVDKFKRFTLGMVTVTDPNDYVRLESESAETFAAFFDKLVERCGGYITFTDNGSGGRAINWLADIGTLCSQPIQFGSNLLEFDRSGQSAELYTAILPYGAQLDGGERVTIESVTEDGADWIQDDAAVELRGRIMATVTWDDVTDPGNLLTKAQAWLSEHKLAVTTLQLTAADLSKLDRNIGSYHIGDLVQVISKPHNVADWFQLTERTIDWLDPAGGNITLGKTINTLTGADVVAQNGINSATSQVKYEVLTVTSANTAAQIQQSEAKLSSQIAQLAGSITLAVSGGLGNSAAIQLTVDGAPQIQTLDLSAVRQAFADDTSAVTITAGTITFNSGTIVINSDNFKVTSDGTITAKAGTVGGWTLKNYKLYAGDGVNIKTVALQAPTDSNLYVFAAGGTSHDSYADCPFRVTKAGKLYATDAVVYGDIITIDGSYKTEMDRGSLRLYFSDVLCGTINTKYWSGASTEGISLRVEEGGNYIMFSHADDTQGSGYVVDYYLNAGWSSNYDEMHIFQTSARFLDGVYVSGPARLRSLRLFGADGEYLVGIGSNGALTVSKL